MLNQNSLNIYCRVRKINIGIILLFFLRLRHKTISAVVLFSFRFSDISGYHFINLSIRKRYPSFYTVAFFQSSPTLNSFNSSVLIGNRSTFLSGTSNPSKSNIISYKLFLFVVKRFPDTVFFAFTQEKRTKKKQSVFAARTVAPFQNRETQAKLRETFSFPASAVFPAETFFFWRPCPFHVVPYCTFSFFGGHVP